MKVVRTFAFQANTLELEKSVFDKENIEIVEIPCPTEEDLIKNCQDADAIICAYEPVTKKVIDALPNLKLIAFKTIGFNYSDFNYAREKGIPVSHISNYCTIEVADYTTGAILSLNRQIFGFNASTHEDKKWQYNLYPNMRRLSTQTIGFLGFGNIPKLVSERLKAFGCKMIAYDPFLDKDEMKQKYGVDMLSFDEVLKNSDILSIHLPENEQTKGVINQENIAKMKDKVQIINAARGGILNEQDVLNAVRSGKIETLVADVVIGEFPDMKTHPFSGERNIILTPHIAWFSKEAMDEGVVECATNVANFFKGNYEKANIVNGVKVR